MSRPHESDDRTLGQVAYEAYVAYADGRSLVSGDPLPTWSQQSRVVQLAWEAAARAVQHADGLL